MSGEELWNRVIVFSLSEKELQTTTGLWFRISSSNDRLYVDKAIEHLPSCKLSKQRSISKKEFLLVYSYYARWVNGEVGVRHEVSNKSRNTAYIFALLDKYI